MSIESPQVLAQKGENIYNNKYKQDYEKKYQGKFVAIDISTEKAYLADTPEEALKKAQKDNPEGFCHLVRVGSEGVFRIGYTSGNHGDWLFRQQRPLR